MSQRMMVVRGYNYDGHIRSIFWVSTDPKALAKNRSHSSQRVFLPYLSRPHPITSKTISSVTHSQQHQISIFFSEFTSKTLNRFVQPKAMAKLTKPEPTHTPHAPGYFHPDVETPRVSTTSDNTLYETASEEQPREFYKTRSEPRLPKLPEKFLEPTSPPKAKPHESRNKSVRNNYGVWVPEPLETGKSEHGPWVPPKPIVEDDNGCCCTIL